VAAVRLTLAQRSAEAAKQIKTLIEDTVAKIGAGDEMVKKTSSSLEQMIAVIDELSGTMDEIAASSAEQARGIDELNRAIASIDTTTQQNASTVEELASTSEKLHTEADELASVVSRFKIGKETWNTARPRPAARRPEPAPEPVRHTPAADQAIEDFEEF